MKGTDRTMNVANEFDEQHTIHEEITCSFFVYCVFFIKYLSRPFFELGRP